MESKKYLVVIPARGGSKRLKNKNLLPLANKPLIAHSIEVANSIPSVDKVIVSTDSEDILKASVEYGAECPFLRPDFLAADTSTTFDVIKHTLSTLETEHKLSFENVILLQPTSPLRTKENLKGAIELFEAKKANAVISVCECEHSPLWSNTLDEEKSMNAFLDSQILNKRSQDLPTYYRLNGAIYIYKTEELLKSKSMFPTKKSFAFEMDSVNSIDIDNQLDFDFAEFMMAKRKK